MLLHPDNPAAALRAPNLNPVAFWATMILLVGLASALAFVLWRIFRGVTKKVDPFRIAGIATRAEVACAASHAAIMKRAAHLRPSLAKADPSDVGYRIGRSRNTAVWASVEDSILVIGPPRSGKGAHIVINAILDAPGPVVTTSTRPDNLTTTLRARQRIGPVAVFDPQ